MSDEIVAIFNFYLNIDFHRFVEFAVINEANDDCAVNKMTTGDLSIS